jgi:hypothetical protein
MARYEARTKRADERQLVGELIRQAGSGHDGYRKRLVWGVRRFNLGYVGYAGVRSGLFRERAGLLKNACNRMMSE